MNNKTFTRVLWLIFGWQCLFLGVKIGGIWFRHLPWWLVFSPIWIPTILAVLALTVLVIISAIAYVKVSERVDTFP